MFGGSLEERFYRYTRDDAGDYYFLGFSFSVDGDLPDSYNNSEATDYWIVETDSSFNKIWSRNFGGSSNAGETYSNWQGNLLIINNMIIAFLGDATPGALPEYDICCAFTVVPYPILLAWIVAFDIITGIEQVLGKQDEIMVYPNPTNDILNIDINASESKDCNLKVFDLLGNLVLAKNYSGLTNIKLNVATLPNGPYLLKVQIGDENLINKKNYYSTFIMPWYAPRIYLIKVISNGISIGAQKIVIE